jgi:NAD(P)-dependent dehydrogenase (short-subunit alcohol dehydrogenase family)
VNNVPDPTILITGATDGVGKLVAKRLAASGVRVLLHGRSDEKGRNTTREIEHDAPNSRLEFYRADLSSLSEVRQLAEEVTSRHARLDVLINNAGIGFGPPHGGREISPDGYELRFAVNYLAPFALTHLLLPLVRRSPPSRIVNVASIGQVPIDFDDVMLTRHYDGTRAYRQSKLALIMFTLDLAEHLDGSQVAVNAVHPATFMNTKMVAEAGHRPESTVEDGADAILQLATSPGVSGVSGRFFDGRHESRAQPQAYDVLARERLRALSYELTHLSAYPS